MIASSRSYAIGMVHFQIGGGWLVTGILLGIYLLCFFGGVALFYYAEYMNKTGGGFVPATDFARFLLGLMIALQGIVLLLVGGYRVSSSIRTDISSRMIESHRLMPIPAWRAVMGYMFGPATPAVMFVALNLILTSAFGAAVGASFTRLVVNQGVIVCFAVFIWSFTALGTFIYRHIFLIGIGVAVFGSCTCMASGIYQVVPGLALLMTPFFGETIFNVGMGAGMPPDLPLELYALGIGGQAVLCSLFFIGTCRLYRGTYITAFSGWQAMTLLGTWALISAVGINRHDDFRLERMFGGGPGANQEMQAAQVVISLATCMLLVMVPLWSFLQEERRRTHRWFIRLLVIAIATLLATASALGANTMGVFSLTVLGATLTVMAAQVVIAYCALRVVRGLRFILAALILLAGLLAINLAPVILEMLILWSKNGDNGNDMPVLITLSPVGMLAAIWGDAQNVPWVYGIAWQWFLAAIMVFIAFAASRRKKPSTPAGVMPPPVQPSLPRGATPTA